MPGLPHNLADRLAPGPALVDGHWLVGYWPAELATRLMQHLDSGGDKAVWRVAQTLGAATIAIPGLRNINHPDDLPPA
jgi:molybdopterin-guanine dinucleotide biosynthesis protein A